MLPRRGRRPWTKGIITFERDQKLDNQRKFSIVLHCNRPDGCGQRAQRHQRFLVEKAWPGVQVGKKKINGHTG